MTDGWICLHRSIEEHPVFEDADVFKVWVWILLSATYRSKSALVGRQVVELKAGQFVFGRKTASQKLKMSESKVYRIVNALKEMGCIKIDTNNRFSIITVENWGKYQADEQQLNNRRTEAEQNLNTTNNVNNFNKYNNITSARECVPTPKATKFSNFTPRSSGIDYRALELKALRKRIEMMRENDG